MASDKFAPVKHLGILFAEIFQLILLFVAGFAILWAAGAEIIHVVVDTGPGLKDILMLFIFIELGAMVGIYFKTNKLSVRFLVYIAITALTRLLVVDIKAMDNATILTITGAIVMLTVAVLILRFCTHWFGGDAEEEE